MKFLDDNVNIEDLEQDELTLSNPKHSKNEHLRVLGICGRQGPSKLLLCECSECKKDPELFKNGLFSLAKGDYISGIIPCGCSKKYRWDHKQNFIRVKRLSDNYRLKSLSEEKRIKDMVATFICEDHGDFSLVLPHIYKQKEIICPECRNNFKLSIQDIESALSMIGWDANILERYVDKRGTRLKVECNVCKNDEYTSVGLCTGVFDVSLDSITLGRKSCRCNKDIRLTSAQKLYKINKIMTKVNGMSDIIGWKETNKTVLRVCKDHGEYVSNYKDMCRDLVGCPKCAGNLQDKAYINFVNDKNNNTIALKFGISGKPEARLLKQKYTTDLDVINYGVWYFKSVDICKEAEGKVKTSVKTSLLSKDLFPDGYTETCDIKYLEDIIKIYEEFGGILIS